MLHAIAPDIWCAENDLFMPGGIHFPVRMIIVRLPDGGLWLHSPIEIDDALAAEIDALGPVRHLVAPNTFHHLYFGPAAKRYPDATTWAARGLSKKRGDLTFAHTLGKDTPPWGEVFEQATVDGVPALNETVFLHRPSGTLIVTDLFFNIQAPANRRSRFFFWMLGVLGRPAQSPLLRLATKDKAAAAASCRRILELPFDRVVPAHGPVVDHDPRQQVAGALQKMIARGPAALPAG